MVIYRPHKGTLADAMKEAKEFNTLDEMKQYIFEEWNKGLETPLFEIEDISLSLGYIYDTRIDWRDTRGILIKRCGEKIYPVPQCIGYCATDYK